MSTGLAKNNGRPQISMLKRLTYTPRRSRPGLMAAMQNVAQEMIDRLLIGADDQLEFVRGNSSTDPRCKISQRMGNPL